MLVLSARNDELGADHPLTHVLGDLPTASVTRITLEPLSPRAVTVLAEQAGRAAADLYRITEGNPFFVTELLASSEAEPKRIPDSIRDAVWARLSRLTAGEREVLEMMSIVPGSVGTVADPSPSWESRPKPLWTSAWPADCCGETFKAR